MAARRGRVGEGGGGSRVLPPEEGGRGRGGGILDTMSNHCCHTLGRICMPQSGSVDDGGNYEGLGTGFQDGPMMGEKVNRLLPSIEIFI